MCFFSRPGKVGIFGLALKNFGNFYHGNGQQIVCRVGTKNKNGRVKEKYTLIIFIYLKKCFLYLSVRIVCVCVETVFRFGNCEVETLSKPCSHSTTTDCVTRMAENRSVPGATLLQPLSQYFCVHREFRGAGMSNE